MTPQERQLVDDLFDRLARLETSPREPGADAAIAEGLRRAPNAVYALVQTVLVQDEALKRADARIRALGGESEPAPEGFLDSVRNALLGAPARRGSVPSVRPDAAAPESRWNTGGALAAAQQAPNAQDVPGRGGSFLGTAAATAAGVIGGALLLNTISSMFGHHGTAQASPFGGDLGQRDAQGSPWGDAAGSDLARDAGLGDIGGGSGGYDRQAGLFGNDHADDADLAGDAGGDFDADFGGDFGGGDSA